MLVQNVSFEFKLPYLSHGDKKDCGRKLGVLYENFVTRY